MVRMEKLQRGRKRKPSLPTQPRTLRSSANNQDEQNDSIKQMPVSDIIESAIKKQKMEDQKTGTTFKEETSIPTTTRQEQMAPQVSLGTLKTQEDIEIVEDTEKTTLVRGKTKDVSREISLSDFVKSRQSVIFSTLSLMPHKKKLITLARSVFGIYEDKIVNGKSIDDKDSKMMLDYLFKKCQNETSSTIDESKTYNQKVFEFKPLNGPILAVYLESVLRLMKRKNDGWLDDCLLDFFTDILNLLFGAHSAFQLEALPAVCCLKQSQLEHLWCLSTLSEHHPNLHLIDPGFAMKFKEFILEGHLKNALANILQMYQQRKNINDSPLTKIFGIINIPNLHFIQTTIDMIERKVTTRDSKPSDNKTSAYRRKWIAKIASICEHYVSNDEGHKKIYLGNQDMQKDTFLPSDESQLQFEDDMKKFSFSFYHEEAQASLFFPPQKDNVNCGIYSLWYHLLTVHQDNNVVALDPDEWRKQILVFIVAVHLYNEKLDDIDYTFPDDFEFKTWLVSDSIPSELLTVFTKIFHEDADPTKKGENEKGSEDHEASAGNKNNPGDDSKSDKNEESKKDGDRKNENQNQKPPGKKDDDNDASDDKNDNDRDEKGNDDPNKKPPGKGDDDKDSSDDKNKKPNTTEERNKLLEINELFMKCYGMHDFGEGFRKLFAARNCNYMSIPLDSLIEDSAWFPDSLRDILGCYGFEVNVNIQWKLNTKKKLRDKYYTFMTSLFNQSKDDKSGIKVVLGKGSTIFVSIQAKNYLDKKKKEPILISFAAMQPIYDQDQFKGIYLDYLGTTNDSPRDIITNYDHNVFTGKGFGKFMVNVIQVIAWGISPKDKPTTKIVLKAADGLKTFYTQMGFKEIDSNHENGLKFLKYPSLQRHLGLFRGDKALKAYILHDFAEIDLLRQDFINHVHQSFATVPFQNSYCKTIVPAMHKIFEDEDYLQKVKLIEVNELKKERGGFTVPIGEAISSYFSTIKPKEFGFYSGLYEFLIKQISWKIEVTRKIKKKTKYRSYDDTNNPIGELSVRCELCDHSHPTTFSLKSKNDEEEEANVRAQVMLILDHFFDEHFNVGNLFERKSQPCEKLTVKTLKQIRDNEMMLVGYHPHLLEGNHEMFKKLMMIFMQVHLEKSNILKFFDWTSFRPTKIARQAKMKSAIINEKRMIDAVLGTNEKKLQQMKKKEEFEQAEKNRLKKLASGWTNLWDDMVFLKHLRFVMCIEKGKHTYDQLQNILNRVKNAEAYNDKQRYQYVGFPDPNEAEQQDSDEQTTNVIGEAEKIRFIDQRWIRETLEWNTRRSMQNQPMRQIRLPNETLEKIKDEMKTLRYKKITHIYKYICPTTLEFKFWNAICKRTSKGKRGSQSHFEYIEGDEVKKEWLYLNAVTINNCKDWYDMVMDRKTTNIFYELPIAAVKSHDQPNPEKISDAPVLQYPQNNIGVCGVSAFSSAFHYTFSTTLSLLIHQERENYLKALTVPISGKKSQALIFLSQIIHQKAFKLYAVQRMKQMISWKKFLESPYYYKIMLCIPKSTSLNRDHIIGITQGWIFDGNLSYAIPLNEDNLSWSASHGESGEVFAGFCEQIQVGLREERKKKKSK